MELHERIAARRKELGLSVEYVAEALGVSRATIYRYESSFIEKLPAKTIEPLAAILRTTPAYLMGWTDGSSEQQEAVSSEDEEIWELRREMSERTEMKTLFSLSKNARKEDIELVNEMLKRMRGDDIDE